MAKGTCPQICAICVQSAVLAFGSNSETRVLAEGLSNGLILSPFLVVYFPQSCQASTLLAHSLD